MAPVTIDLVGCGEAMVRWHVPVMLALRREGLVTVRRCYDPSAERAESVAARLGAEPSTAGPVATDELSDAAVVASPPDHHFEAAFAYLERGGTVLVEKPVVTTLEELDRLLAAPGRCLVGHMRRLSPAVQGARAFVLAGCLGEIARVEATEGFRWGWNSSSDYFVRSPFGGVIHDTGSHVVDTLGFVLGLDAAGDGGVEVGEVHKEPAAEPSHAVHARLTLSVGSQTIPVTLRLDRRNPLAAGIRLFGSRGVLVVPSEPARHAILWRDEGPLEIGLPADALDVAAHSLPGAFAIEDRLLVQAASGGAPRSILDAGRFRFTTAVLERIWSAA